MLKLFIQIERKCFSLCFVSAAFLLVQLISCKSNDGEGANSDGATEEQVREALSSGSIGVQLFSRGSHGRRRTGRHGRSSWDCSGSPRCPWCPQGQTVSWAAGKQEEVKSGTCDSWICFKVDFNLCFFAS